MIIFIRINCPFLNDFLLYVVMQQNIKLLLNLLFSGHGCLYIGHVDCRYSSHQGYIFIHFCVQKTFHLHINMDIFGTYRYCRKTFLQLHQ